MITKENFKQVLETLGFAENNGIYTRKYNTLLNKELEMVAVFQDILSSCVKSGVLNMNERELFLAANHLVVQGQSWAFRKWALKNHFTIEEYIQLQTNLFLNGVLHFEK